MDKLYRVCANIHHPSLETSHLLTNLTAVVVITSQYPFYSTLTLAILTTSPQNNKHNFVHTSYPQSTHTLTSILMAAVPVTCVRLTTSMQTNQIVGKSSTLKLVGMKSGFPFLNTSRFQVCCAAKPETVNKVCEIVKTQLALSADSVVAHDSKFSTLGADSLDTVEIVMTLEEEFGISVEEENSQNITTVQEAADLIEKLVEKKNATA